MVNIIKKYLFFSFTTSNKVLCGTSCPDLQKTQEDAFKTQIRNEEGKIITKLKKIFNLEDNEIVGLTEKSFINGSLTISFRKIKIFDNNDKKDDELKKVDELIEAEIKNEENKDYYVYLDYINYQVQGKVINQDNKTSIYILIKNAKKVDDKKFKLYKFDDTKEKDKEGNIIDSNFVFAKNFQFTNADSNKEVFIKKADIDALDK